jgi:hypothetical protein
MRAARAWPAASRWLIWPIRPKTLLLDEVDQPLEHLRLAGEMPVQAPPR